MNIRIAFAVLPLFLGACQSSDSKPEPRTRLEKVDDLSAHGEYEKALLEAEAYYREHPQDPEGELQYRRASAAVMLDQARKLCFAEKNLEALERVREARAIVPEERVIADWEKKLLAKLASIHANNGDEFFASTNLEGAREEYEKALSYVPDDLRASAALSQVLLQINYRRGMGEGYYEDGVHLLRDYWLEQSRGRFSYNLKYLPDNERGKKHKKQVETQLALSRCTLAQDLERKGLWAAARNEYRIALLIDPELEEAKAGLESTRREANAEDKLREIERMTRNKQFDEAEELIASARGLSTAQGDRFDGAAAGIEEARLLQQYNAALALESDQEYDAAVQAYDKLLSRRDYYKDALTRRDTLKGWVDKAAALYQQALETTDPVEKLKLLRQIAVFWPEYKNVSELLAMLQPVEPAADGTSKP